MRNNKSHPFFLYMQNTLKTSKKTVCHASFSNFFKNSGENFKKPEIKFQFLIPENTKCKLFSKSI